MQGQKNYRWWLAVLTGVLLGVTGTYIHSWFVWTAFVPLILAMKKAPGLKGVAALAFFAAVPAGLIMFWWLVPAVQRFTGSGTWIGLVGLVFFTFTLFFWLLALFGAFRFILHRMEGAGMHGFWMPTVLFALLFFLIDFLRVHSFQGLVWNKFTLSAYLAGSPHSMQLSPLIGALGVGLMVAGVNHLLAEAIARKNIRPFLTGAGIFLANLIYGYAVIEAGGGHSPYASGPKVAILSGNVPAEAKWEESGDRIVVRMLGLVSQAGRERPDLMVWPESALPWTYMDGDDILVEIARITGGHATQSIMGYLSADEQRPDKVYNSAYLIGHDARFLGRYDKIRLLDFTEQPFGAGGMLSMALPVTFENVVAGSELSLLNTRIGSARVMICNESLLPWYFTRPRETPDFLVNMNNNAWVEGTPYEWLHFDVAAQRAIETRKDLIVSSNRGVSGIVNKYGVVLLSQHSDEPLLLTGRIRPNTSRTLYARMPLLLPATSFIALIALTFFPFRKKPYLFTKTKTL